MESNQPDHTLLKARREPLARLVPILPLTIRLEIDNESTEWDSALLEVLLLRIGCRGRVGRGGLRGSWFSGSR